MFNGALVLNILGLKVYAYGLLLMLGCWLAIALGFALAGKGEKPRLAAALTALLALLLGLVLARLLYVLGEPTFKPLLNLKNALRLGDGGYAMYGALLGAALAALIASRAVGVSPLRQLDILSPALLAFLVPARLGEGFTALGISRPLTTPFIINSFLARHDEYDAYLRTYLLEAIIALVLLFFLLRLFKKQRKAGMVFAWFCLLYGLSQTLMESLRYDGHLRYSFVGVQQVLSAALFSVTLIVLAVRALKQGRGRLLPILSLAALPFILLGIVGVEFLVDRSELGKLFSYGLYVLVLAIPGALGILMLKQEETIGQGID